MKRIRIALICVLATLCGIPRLAQTQVGPKRDFATLQKDLYKNGVFNVPVIKAWTEDTVVGIEYEETSSNQVVKTTTRSALISRSSGGKDTLDSTYSATVKRNMSLGIVGSLGLTNSFQLQGGVGASYDSVSNSQFRSVREESSEDSKKLEEFEKFTSDTTIKFGANSGFFHSAVVLRDLTNASGYVENMRVTLHAMDLSTNVPETIDAVPLCDIQGVTKDVAASAPAVPDKSTSNCRIRVPAYDPSASPISIPVTFKGYNTGRVRDYMGRRVWIEVDPLSVSVGKDAIEAVNVDKQLKNGALSFTVIDEKGDISVQFVQAQHPISPREALTTIYEKNVEFSDNPKRIARIGAKRSNVLDWKTPAAYTNAELDDGAWILASADFQGSLDDKANPGSSFVTSYLTKRDLLSTLDHKVTRAVQMSTFASDRTPMMVPGNCFGNTVEADLRVLPGDLVSLTVSTYRQDIHVVQTDFTKYPRAPDYGKFLLSPYSYRDFYDATHAQETTASEFGETVPVNDADLKQYGLGLRFDKKSPPLDISDILRVTGGSVNRFADGTAAVQFTINSQLLPSGYGAMCANPHPLTKVVKTGRDGTQPTIPGGWAITPNSPPVQDLLSPWLQQFPLQDREYPYPTREKVNLVLTRIGRSVDDPAVVAMDRDLEAFLVKPCIDLKKSIEISSQQLARANLCPADGALASCLGTALSPSAAGGFPVTFQIPPGIDLNRYKNQVLVQTCGNRFSMIKNLDACSDHLLQSTGSEGFCLSVMKGMGVDTTPWNYLK